jgi:hypothetical protein
VVAGGWEHPGFQLLHREGAQYHDERNQQTNPHDHAPGRRARFGNGWSANGVPGSAHFNPRLAVVFGAKRGIGVDR